MRIGVAVEALEEQGDKAVAPTASIPVRRLVFGDSPEFDSGWVWWADHRLMPH